VLAKFRCTQGVVGFRASLVVGCSCPSGRQSCRSLCNRLTLDLQAFPSRDIVFRSPCAKGSGCTLPRPWWAALVGIRSWDTIPTITGAKGRVMLQEGRQH